MDLRLNTRELDFGEVTRSQYEVSVPMRTLLKKWGLRERIQRSPAVFLGKEGESFKDCFIRECLTLSPWGFSLEFPNNGYFTRFAVIVEITSRLLQGEDVHGIQPKDIRKLPLPLFSDRVRKWMVEQARKNRFFAYNVQAILDQWPAPPLEDWELETTM